MSPIFKRNFKENYILQILSSIPKLEVGPVCTTIDHIPYRHQFDSEIYQGNLENYEAAVKADLNGDDSREQRVWWNRR